MTYNYIYELLYTVLIFFLLVIHIALLDLEQT